MVFQTLPFLNPLDSLHVIVLAEGVPVFWTFWLAQAFLLQQGTRAISKQGTTHTLVARFHSPCQLVHILVLMQTATASTSTK